MSVAPNRIASGAALGGSFEIPVRVYYEDTDAGGIVYYANYLRFFERARTEWLRALGGTHEQMEADDGLLFVVRDLALEYRKPARLDDLLVVDVRVTEARRASVTLAQAARRGGSAEILVSATVRLAAMRRGASRPSALPDWLLGALNR